MQFAVRALVCVFAFTTLCLTSCGGQTPARSASAAPPRCAGTFVSAITSPDPTPGVWDCLTASYQSRLQGAGDGIFAVRIPLWTLPRYIGLDHNIALFDLTVNGRVDPSVYNPPVMHVVMAVYLDPQGLVDHAKSATPAT